MERQQLKWVAYAGVLLIGSFLLVSPLEGREIVAPVQLAVDISFFVLGVLGVSTAVAASSGASDRRFNRRRYDAARTIEEFSTRLREELTGSPLGRAHGRGRRDHAPGGRALWLRPDLQKHLST